MSKVIQELKSGVVLAELGGYGDGPYCAKHGSGAALAMMGTYIVDPGDDVPYPSDFVFKTDKSSYMTYLREHLVAGRKGGSRIGVSVCTVKLSRTLDFLVAAEEAGADYVSLCAHSTMEMFVKEHLGEELCRPENAELLKEWALAILNAVSVPVIFKIGLTDPVHTSSAIDIMANNGVPVVHINLRETHSGSRGLNFLKTIKGKCKCLIVSGGIRNIDDARRVIDNGADAIAIGTAAMKDPSLCGTVQQALCHL